MLSYNANGFYNSFDLCYEFFEENMNIDYTTLKTSNWNKEIWISYKNLNKTMFWCLKENQLFL